MINAVNYVTGGRNFETLGEDPYLAGQLVAPEVQGVQGKGMIAEIKHYIENDFENGRTSTSVTIDDQTLHETELQAFEAAIDAGAGAVMCSYNRINDVYGCGNDATLQRRPARAARLQRLRHVRLGRGAPRHRPAPRQRHRAAGQRRRHQHVRPAADDRGHERHRRGARDRRLPGRARASPRREWKAAVDDSVLAHPDRG